MISGVEGMAEKYLEVGDLTASFKIAKVGHEFFSLNKNNSDSLKSQATNVSQLGLVLY